MIARWFASRLFGPIASAAIVLLFVLLTVQTIRIDGFPVVWTGLRTELAECRTQQGKANDAVLEALDKGREEGRQAANADGERLRQTFDETNRELQKRIAELEPIVKGLNAPRPPLEVDSPLPVVVTPAIASCPLDRGALDELTSFLNRERAP